jgi:hypothetical protein
VLASVGSSVLVALVVLWLERSRVPARPVQPMPTEQVRGV